MDKSTFNRWSAFSGDVATVVVAIVVLVLAAQRYLTPPMALNPMTSGLLNIDVNDEFDIDFAAVDRTAVVVVRQDCPACTESLSFYRQLTAQAAERVQVVFAAPVDDTGIAAHLASHGVNADRVVFMSEPGNLPFLATPTILLVGTDGIVSHAWVGVLSPDAEVEVVRTLFDAA